MSALHIIQHVPFEPAGILPELAAAAGWTVTTTHQYAGDPPPPISAIDRLVVMGGPMGVYDEDLFAWMPIEKALIREAIQRDVPVLGICLGAQLLAEALGGEVFRNDQKEIGFFETRLRPEARASRFFANFPERFYPLHWHGDTFTIPPSAVHIAESTACSRQAFVIEEAGHIGLQFHLEMTPELLAGLLNEDDEELVPAPFIQSADEMRRTMKDHLNRAMPLMEDLFRRWLA